MATFLLVIHVTVSFFLIFIVLIQGGKGAEMGAAFGGSSQTLFGGRGSATFLGKMTTVVAIIFMTTSLLLAIVSAKGASVIKQTSPLEQPVTAPAHAFPGVKFPPPGNAAPLEEPSTAGQEKPSPAKKEPAK